MASLNLKATVDTSQVSGWVEFMKASERLAQAIAAGGPEEVASAGWFLAYSRLGGEIDVKVKNVPAPVPEGHVRFVLTVDRLGERSEITGIECIDDARHVNGAMIAIDTAVRSSPRMPAPEPLPVPREI